MVLKKNEFDIFLKELQEPEQYPGFLLWQASNIWYRNMKNRLKKFGTTFTQFTILMSMIYLSKQNENINQKQIARHSKLDIMMTSDVLKTLESKKLVTRCPNPNDRRHNSMKITQEGINLVLNTFGHVNQADINFFKVLEDNVQSLTESLEKLIQANYDNIYIGTEKPLPGKQRALK
jgi:DNA-binding MarR family transcriptional regulator